MLGILNKELNNLFIELNKDYKISIKPRIKRFDKLDPFIKSRLVAKTAVVSLIAWTILTIIGGQWLGLLGFIAAGLYVGVKTLDRLDENYIIWICGNYMLHKDHLIVKEVRNFTRPVADFMDTISFIDKKTKNKIQKERLEEDRINKLRSENRMIADIWHEIRFLVLM